jgi:SAM-dependent methyltransferase
MTSEIEGNRAVWNRMFDWVNSRGGRKYPNETLVIWLLGYARSDHRDKRVLDIGCGWSQSLGLFLDEGFRYWGVDVTDRGFRSNPNVDAPALQDRAHWSVFTPPKLEFDDAFFTHVVSMEALHLNPTPSAFSAIVRECHRVLQPDGRFFATLIHPDYWYVKLGYVDWVGANTVRINARHPDVAARGAHCLVLKDDAEIRAYFSDFRSVSIGHEMRRFGEDREKVTSYWIVSATK